MIMTVRVRCSGQMPRCVAVALAEFLLGALCWHLLRQLSVQHVHGNRSGEPSPF